MDNNDFKRKKQANNKKKKKQPRKNGDGGVDVVFLNPLLRENFTCFSRICSCDFLVFLASS